MLLAHEPPAHPEQPANTPAPPGEEAYVPPTLQGVMFAIEPARSAVADFCVLWQTGALLSTNKEMRDGRGELARAGWRVPATGIILRGAPISSPWVLSGCGARRRVRVGMPRGVCECRRREFRLEQPVSNPERYSQSFAAGAKPRGVSD